MKFWIWVTGLLSSAMFGFLIGVALFGVGVSAGSPDDDPVAAGFLVGAPGGALAFVCFRLWRREAGKSSAVGNP